MYLIQAIQRNKDGVVNKNAPRLIRKVVNDDADISKAVSQLRHTLQQYPGIWRIYRSVNRRDEAKAKRALQHALIDGDQRHIESLWKTLLMQPANKAERLFLIDVDTKEDSVYNLVLKLLVGEYCDIKELKSTPNGHHIVVTPFNSKVLTDRFEEELVSVKKDALLYIETVEVT